jgi:hypothetical protein
MVVYTYHIRGMSSLVYVLVANKVGPMERTGCVSLK